MARPVNKALDAIRKPTRDELAFFAGFYEGEGYCIRVKNTASVHIAQKDPEVLHKLCECFGGRAWFLATNKNPHWRWAVYGARAESFLSLIYALLSKRRQIQIDRMKMSIGVVKPEEEILKR